MKQIQRNKHTHKQTHSKKPNQKKMQMKNFCLLVLAVMAADTCKAQDSSFNFEISKRTENTIRSFIAHHSKQAYSQCDDA